MPDIPRWVVDAATIVAAVAAIGLAVATLVLAFATRKLAHTAADESTHLAAQADATTALAKTSVAQLDELKIQNRQRPLLYFEQRELAYVWEPGAETVAPKTGKRVALHFVLRIENLGGPAFMGDARIAIGDGTIAFESPRKLVSPDRAYMVKITYEAIGGTPSVTARCWSSRIEHGTRTRRSRPTCSSPWRATGPAPTILLQRSSRSTARIVLRKTPTAGPPSTIGTSTTGASARRLRRQPARTQRNRSSTG